MQQNVIKYSYYRQKKREKTHRSAWLLVFTLLFLGLLAIYLASPLALVAEIKVKGTEFTDPEDLLQLAGLEAGQHMWQLNLREKRDKLSAHPWLSSVVIRRQLPNHLILVVTERVPLAAYSIEGGGWLPLAGDGTLLTHCDDLSLPFLTGLAPGRVEPGHCLTEPGIDMSLELLTALSPLAEELSELNIGGLPLYFTLYTYDGYRIEMFADEDYRARVDDLVAMLAELRSKGKRGIIDLRTRPGHAVFSPYE